MPERQQSAAGWRHPRRGRHSSSARAECAGNRSRIRARRLRLAASLSLQLGYKADKIGKDDNFRGLTIFNNVLYYSKGSGSNGVNTVYFLDTTGSACPTGRRRAVCIGYTAHRLRSPYNPSTISRPTAFPATCASSTGSRLFLTKTATAYGVSLRHLVRECHHCSTWRMKAMAIPAERISTRMRRLKPRRACRSGSSIRPPSTWNLAYTLQTGLNLGMPYTVPKYPTGNNPGTGLPWAPASDGLRNITGQINLAIAR